MRRSRINEDYAAYGVTNAVRSGRVRTHPPQKPWRRRMQAVLATWTHLEKQLTSRVGEVAHCYSERNNIGLLAAAAWCSGEIAIEEFATLRGERWPSPGRNDLYLRLGETALCIEAKLAAIEAPLTQSEWYKFRKLVRALLRAARREAVHARTSRRVFQYRVGLVFCVLWMGRRRQKDFGSKRTHFVFGLRQQLEQPPVDFWAVHLPGPVGCHWGRGGLRRYAGVLLLGSLKA